MARRATKRTRRFGQENFRSYKGIQPRAPDAVLPDMEDSVPPGEKERARETLVHQEGCARCPECGYNKCE